jgi:hypothetical protein
MKPSRRLVLLCLLAALLTAIPRARAATPEQVDEAIKKAINYIYTQQASGNWEMVQKREKDDPANVEGYQWGGLSSLATCALLYARESPQDPRLKEAIDFLLKADIHGIYALGFRCQVWQMTSNVPGVKEKAFADFKLLLEAVHKRGAFTKGMYPYAYDKGKAIAPDWYDHSVSQYGVLAMWALNQMNIEIPADYWRVIETAWREQQNDDGGWSYKFREGDGTSTVPMTAAGIATLFITQDYVHSMEGLACNGNVKDKNLDLALRWLSANFKNIGDNYYAFYGMERIGVASGYKYFGNQDWYQVGADFLVKSQKEDGSWGDEAGRDNAKKIPNTGFGLMFLVRGRAPVMMNKLDYTAVAPDAAGAAGEKPKPAAAAGPGSWNQRPREVANITRWVGKQVEKDLNWQIVNFTAKAEELHDAPILWISGREALNFTDEQQAKLKAFVEGGGLILGHADCASKPFADSFKKLGSKLFPYEFKELPESHPIYTNEQYNRKLWKTQLSVLGLGNGARELMLLIPAADPGKGWQTQAFGGKEREPLAQLMADIFLYSVDKKNLRNKGETYIVTPGPSPASKTIKVARLEYAGNWNPEPGGWRRLSAVMHNQHETDLAVENLKLGEGKLAGFPVAHLTGTTKFNLPANQEAELKKFVEDGGTLIVDATGGAGEFAAVAEGLMTKMFGAKALNLVKGENEIYNNASDAPGQVEYRQYAKKVLGNIKSPRLRMATAGKGRVFLSQEDLSVGLVGQPVDGIYGYEPKTATAIVANIILTAGK